MGFKIINLTYGEKEFENLKREKNKISLKLKEVVSWERFFLILFNK